MDSSIFCWCLFVVICKVRPSSIALFPCTLDMTEQWTYWNWLSNYRAMTRHIHLIAQPSWKSIVGKSKPQLRFCFLHACLFYNTVHLFSKQQKWFSHRPLSIMLYWLNPTLSCLAAFPEISHKFKKHYKYVLWKFISVQVLGLSPLEMMILRKKVQRNLRTPVLNDHWTNDTLPNMYCNAASVYDFLRWGKLWKFLGSEA